MPFRLFVLAVLLVVGVLCWVGLAPAQQSATRPLPPGIQVYRDLAYTRPGEKAQLLDLYLPEQAGAPLPVVLWVHGGGWTSGSKDGGGPALFLVRSGFAVAAINYRLSSEAIFPAQIEDCKAAVRWLRANAATYHLDGNRIGAWGSSAGGHLVALLGTSGGEKALEGTGGNAGYSSRVQAVVDFCGPTDFQSFLTQYPERSANPNTPEGKLLGGPLRDKQTLARKASPTTYIDKTDPPFLIMHGDQDTTVPIMQSQVLYDKLNAAGVTATFEVIKGAGHGFGGQGVALKVLEFFRGALVVGR
jgi:acetyl esterase/lipase